MWSDPTRAYRQALDDLKAGRRVLFTGTPCQVAALSALARRARCADNLLTLDFVCHGTPRPEIYASYVKELEAEKGEPVIRYEFRNKDWGWNFARQKVTFADGSARVLWADRYFAAFARNYSLRSGCFHCPFVGLERPSDFTMADCWRVATSHPEWDDNRGTSLVLVNSVKAQALWDALVETKTLKSCAYDLDLAQLRNRPLQQRPACPQGYGRFQKTFDETESFHAAFHTFGSVQLVLRTLVVFAVKKLGWRYFRRHQ